MEAVMDIGSIVRKYRTIAVVGLSAEQESPSLGIVSYLKTLGYRIIPVSDEASEILGEKTWSSLKEISFPVEIVQVFGPSDSIERVARDAVDIGAKVLWLQEGLESTEAKEICSEASMDVVMDRCFLKEYRRTLGNLISGGIGCMNC
jgi:predicted CoA-binding protein